MSSFSKSAEALVWLSQLADGLMDGHHVWPDEKDPCWEAYQNLRILCGFERDKRFNK